MKLLLKQKEVDVAADDNYAIRRARTEGHVEVVKVLEDVIAQKNLKTDLFYFSVNNNKL